MKENIYLLINVYSVIAEQELECTFNFLTNKWRIFYRPLNVYVQLADDIINRNFIRAGDGYKYEDTLSYVGVSDTSDNLQLDIVNYARRTLI